MLFYLKSKFHKELRWLIAIGVSGAFEMYFPPMLLESMRSGIEMNAADKGHLCTDLVHFSIQQACVCVKTENAFSVMWVVSLQIKHISVFII